MTDDDTDDYAFTEMQYKLYHLLEKKRGHDVLIRDMYYCLYGVPKDMLVSVRDMQQKLAPIIARINDKLVMEVIRPGQLKQTYRLTRHSD